MTTIHVPAMLRHLAGNQEQISISLPPGETRTVREVLKMLEPRFPGLHDALEVDGDVALSVAVFIDEEQAAMGLDAKVTDSSSLIFAPPIVGGA